MQGLSERRYARVRGVSRTTVQRYKRLGMLALHADGSIDAKGSDRRLAECLDPAKRRGPRDGDAITLTLADIERLVAKWERESDWGAERSARVPKRAGTRARP